ncbi:MAG TPA: hypothetical protein DDZ51_10450 [Planctomycetaceae bacterium]|nr:hypothetical protein [Planctomycetaceae bacterium]
MNLDEVEKLCDRLQAETKRYREKLSKIRSYETNQAAREAKWFEKRIQEVLTHCRNFQGGIGSIRCNNGTWSDQLILQSKRFYSQWQCLCELEADD